MIFRYLLFSLIVFLNLSIFAQSDLKQFNGKTYKVFDQYVFEQPYSTYNNPILSMFPLNLQGLGIPPLIGNYEDGDYIIYKIKVDYNKRRKGAYSSDTIFKVFATFTLVNNLKEGYVDYYDFLSGKLYLKLPYLNDRIHGSVHYTGKLLSFNSFSSVFNLPIIFNANQVFEDFKQDIDQIGFGRAELNFYNGLTHGLQKIIGIKEKKETHCLEFNCEMGALNGQYRLHELISKDKSKKNTVELTGFFQNYYRVGTAVMIQRNTNNRIEAQFQKGQLVCLNTINESNYIKRSVLIESDTIDQLFDLKDTLHFKWHYRFQELKMNLVIPNFESKKICIMEYKDGHRDTLIKYGLKVNSNFLKCIYNISDVRDSSVFNKKVIKVLVNHEDVINEYVYELSSNEAQSKNSYFGFMPGTVNDKLDLIYIKMIKGGNDTNLFYSERFLQNSSKYLSDSAQKLTLLRVNEYAYGVVKYNDVWDVYSGIKFKEIEHLSDHKVPFTLRYKRVQFDGQSYLVKVIQLPAHNNVFVITDTLMSGKASLDQELIPKLFSFKVKFPKYLNQEDLINSSDINDHLYNLFVPRAKLHLAIELNRQPYQGLLNIKFLNDTNSKDNKIKRNVKADHVLKIQNKLFDPYNYIHNFMFAEMNDLYIDVSDQNVKSLVALNGKGQYVFSTSYEDNLMSGNFGLNYYSAHKNEDRKSKDPIKLKFLLGNRINMLKGEISRQATIFNSNDSKSRMIVNYENGVLKGPQIGLREPFGSSQMVMTTFFDADSGLENSDCKLYYESGRLLSKGSFKHGLANGTWLRYADVDSVQLVSMIKYEYGQQVDTAVFWDKVGNLSHREFNLNSFQNKTTKIDFIDLVHLRDPFSHPIQTNLLFQHELKVKLDSAFFVYYYNNGNVFSNGTLLLEKKPIGLWNFYHLNGVLFKSIDYGVKRVTMPHGGIVKSFGLTKCYYPNGQLMYSGHITEKFNQFSCDAKSGIPIDEIEYLEFYDSTGKSMLDSGSGYISEYLSNGYKLREGQLLNFKKNGTWLEYDRFGNPISIGKYENGLKVGRWITGDLSGIKLPSNICFMSEENYMNFIKYNGRNLELFENIYIDGRLMQSNSFNVIKK